MNNYKNHLCSNYTSIIKVSAVILIFIILLMTFSGCKNEPKVLYHSNSVEVISDSVTTTVYDLIGDNAYTFKAVRVKRSESVLEPHIAVETDTIKIEIIPSGLRVYDKTANKIFTYQRKSLHNKG